MTEYVQTCIACGKPTQAGDMWVKIAKPFADLKPGDTVTICQDCWSATWDSVEGRRRIDKMHYIGTRELPSTSDSKE